MLVIICKWIVSIQYTHSLSLFSDKQVISPNNELALNDNIQDSKGSVEPSPQTSGFYMELTESQYNNTTENAYEQVWKCIFNCSFNVMSPNFFFLLRKILILCRLRFVFFTDYVKNWINLIWGLSVYVYNGEIN